MRHVHWCSAIVALLWSADIFANPAQDAVLAYYGALFDVTCDYQVIYQGPGAPQDGSQDHAQGHWKYRTDGSCEFADDTWQFHDPGQGLLTRRLVFSQTRGVSKVLLYPRSDAPQRAGPMATVDTELSPLQNPPGNTPRVFHTWLVAIPRWHDVVAHPEQYQFSLVSQDEGVLVAEVVDPATNFQITLTLDKGRGLLPVDQVLRHASESSLDIRLHVTAGEEVVPGVWYPTRFAVVDHRSGGQSQYSLTNVQVNAAIDDQKYDVTLPPKTLVNDVLAKKTYKVPAPSGESSPSAMQEALNQTIGIAKTFDPPPGSIAAPVSRSRYSAWTWGVFGAAIAVVSAVVFYVGVGYLHHPKR